MFLKILKKDLKRNKTMNVILFLFVTLAAVFVASGLSNLAAVLTGADNYLKKAGVGDYNVMAYRKSEADVLKVFDDKELVDSYRVDRGFNTLTDAVSDESGKKLDFGGFIGVQSPEESGMKFFYTDKTEITEVEKGHAYIGGGFPEKEGMKPGDRFYITIEDVKTEFIYDGKCMDAFLGSSFMGNIRILISEEDYLELLKIEKIEDYEILTIYADTDNPSKLSTALAEIKGAMFAAGRSMIIAGYLLDIMLAMVVVVLSICLMIVAFVFLKFSIGFAIQEDFREIGVMKAIGIRDRKIRSLYMVKYIGLGAAGAITGFILGIPFGNMMMSSISKNMILENNLGYVMYIAGALLVFLTFIGFAFICTGKLKKMTPTDAIRSGESGERFKKKGGLRISRAHSKNYLYLAVNDILSSPKKYIKIIISISICTLFLLMLSNTSSTLNSDSCINLFGLPADLYVDIPDSAREKVRAQIEKEHPEITDTFDQMRAEFGLWEEKLAEAGIPATMSQDRLLVYKFKCGDNVSLINCLQGLNNDMDYYKMEKGDVPRSAYEIAITEQVSETLGAKIGDTVLIDFGDGEKECMVTGIFQSMISMGNVARLHRDAPTTSEYGGGAMYPALIFDDNPSNEEIENRKELVREIFGVEKVYNKTEICVDTMNTYDLMKSLEYMLMGVTIVVVILITILMEKTFVTDEKKQIAILKAIGFRDGEVIKWHVVRFIILSGISVAFSALISIPVTKLVMTPVFNIMGSTSIDFVYDFRSLFVYPLIIVAVTALASRITALYTRTIKAVDTASIE